MRASKGLRSAADDHAAMKESKSIDHRREVSTHLSARRQARATEDSQPFEAKLLQEEFQQ